MLKWGGNQGFVGLFKEVLTWSVCQLVFTLSLSLVCPPSAKIIELLLSWWNSGTLVDVMFIILYTFLPQIFVIFISNLTSVNLNNCSFVRTDWPCPSQNLDILRRWTENVMEDRTVRLRPCDKDKLTVFSLCIDNNTIWYMRLHLSRT